MLSFLASLLLGILTGLGIGGGSLLLLLLTAVFSVEPAIARGVSLLFFFPAAIVSCISKRKSIPFRSLLPAMGAGILSAALFSLLSRSLDPQILKKAMGILFLAVGLSELLKRKKENRRP